MTQTLLKIQGAGMPPMLLEECTQVLEALPLGGLHRTVNGELIYTGVPGMMKYKTVCAGTGKAAPGLDTLKRGDQVRVQCIQRLWQEMEGPESTLSRPAVPNTVLVMTEQRQPVTHTLLSPTQITVKKRPAESLYLSYCPLLIMRVVDLTLNTVEWGETTTWKIKLEEV